jgi:hypothetical protein
VCSRRRLPKGLRGPAGPTRSPRDERSKGSARSSAFVVQFRWPLEDSGGLPHLAAQTLVLSARRYRTKLRLAEGMLKKEILGSGLPFRYIVFDAHYSAAGWFTRRLVGWVSSG